MNEILARRALAASAVVLVGGLAMAGAASPLLGGVLVLAGWAGLVFGIHRFGRLGEERSPR